MWNNRKIIFTIDVDAFFAQAEEKRNPSYKNKSIGIGHLLNKKGVLSTCNYKARKNGIYSGQPIFKAMKIDPSLIIIPPDYDYYISLSEKIFSIIKKYVNKLETASIDECFIDVTGKIKIDEDPINYAKKIQDEIYKQTNITVSIGISESKILSKIASNFNKPFGIATLYKSEIKEKLWNLDLEKMYGIGFRTALKFKEKNINTIGDLAKLDPNSNKYIDLRDSIGINLLDLIKKANGNDNSELDDSYHFVKSLSHAKTFPRSLNDYETIREEILELTKIVVSKMKYRNLVCRTVGLQTKDKLKRERIITKDKSFLVKKHSTIQTTLKNPTDNLEEIYAQLIKIFDDWYVENMNINYLGVRVSNFIERFHFGQQLYFDEVLSNENKNLTEVENLIKYLNHKIGNEVFATAYDFFRIKRFHDKSLSTRDSIKFKRWNI